ncbi:MAG: RidA family protein [Candidatus Bathyarchaeia archaeon]
MGVESKLDELGIKLPSPPKPLGAYVPTVKVGNLVFISGMKSSIDGKMRFTGKVGSDITLEEGYEAARICALNCLSALKADIGSLDKVDRIVQVFGFVNSAEGFNQQPKVLNGASDLLLSYSVRTGSMQG